METGLKSGLRGCGQNYVTYVKLECIAQKSKETEPFDFQAIRFLAHLPDQASEKMHECRSLYQQF